MTFLQPTAASPSSPKPLLRGFMGFTTLFAATAVFAANPLGAVKSVDWRYYGGSHNFDRYSPLSLINKDNVSSLEVLWRRPGLDGSLGQKFPELAPSPYFKGTPIMVERTLFAPDGVGLVEAFDAVTGKTIWVQQPFGPTLKEAAGVSSRGVEYWRDGSDERIIVIRGDYLYALDAKTGAYLPAFGEGGRVLLRRKTLNNTGFQGTNGPIVVGDVIVVSGNGGGDGDNGGMLESAPEDVRGYDVRTGALLWTFHVEPKGSEPGHETWPDVPTYFGAMGAWAGMSADERLGYVYLPLTAPASSWYGGHRKGDNLYSDSLVVLDAKTGKRVWHYQMVHHDLWDRDNASPPTLAKLKVDGRSIDAVIQPNKTGFLFVFDRKTGKPVWPIEERPVPQSTVPGEVSSPTQPFPTKPPAMDRQGFTEDDLIDFTPQLRAEAKEIASRYEPSSLFTPPRVDGSGKAPLMLPGGYGSSSWNSGAFDPETGIYYAVSMTEPMTFPISKPKKNGATMRYDLVEENPVGSPPTFGEGISSYGIGPEGLPLVKPPYGRITAYDMNKGEKKWMVANGDGPRDHPALKGLKLPPLGTTGRPAPLVTGSLLFLGESSDAVSGHAGVPDTSTFRAYDKLTGALVWQTQLPSGTTSNPMTYAVDGEQVIVIPIGNRSNGGEWIALGLGK